MNDNPRARTITGWMSKGCSAVMAGAFLMSLTPLQNATGAVPLRKEAQQLNKRMTNQDVLDMVSLGLSDDVIIDKIHATTRADFDTGVTGLRALKAGKVSDAVIRVMINPTAKAAITSTDDAASLTPDVWGLYRS